MMNSSYKSTGRAVLPWLLVLALLLGQSLALGHDHDAGQDVDEACVLCLFAQQADDIIPSMAAGLPVQVSHVHSSHAFTQNTFAVTVPPFHSRAPPAISR